MKRNLCLRSISSERGVALLLVLVLSAVSLALITALLYMITVGTQSSGMHKRYRTALEAGVAGSDLIFQVIDKRGDNSAITSLLNSWSTAGLPASTNIPASCQGYALATGSTVTVTGAATKNMTSTTSPWSASCGLTSLSTGTQSYDYQFQVGTNPVYNVYAKIVDVREGNTGTGGITTTNKLINSPVVGGSSGGGEIQTSTIPYLYTIEIDAENSVNTDQKAKLSILYQW